MPKSKSTNTIKKKTTKKKFNYYYDLDRAAQFERKVEKNLNKITNKRLVSKRKQRNKTAVVFVLPNGDVELSVHSHYTPELTMWGYEYLQHCLDSLERQERFLAQIVEVRDKDGVLLSKTMREQREELTEADRYKPLVSMASHKGYAAWLMRKKNKIVAYSTLARYANAQKDDGTGLMYPDFAQMWEIMRDTSEMMYQQLSANDIGQANMHKFMLTNNHGYKDVKAENTVNIGIGNVFAKLYQLANVTYKPDNPELIDPKNRNI